MNIEVAQAVALTGSVGAIVLAGHFVKEMHEQYKEDKAWSFTYRHRELKRNFQWLLLMGVPIVGAVGFVLGCLGGFFGQIVVHLWKVLIA